MADEQNEVEEQVTEVDPGLWEEQPAVTGRPNEMVTGSRSFGNLASGGMTARAPLMPMGMIGTPARSASRAGPVWPR